MTDDSADDLPLLPPDQMPPLADQAALDRTWRALMGRLGFATPQLWVLLVDGDQPQQVIEIADVPLDPRPDEVGRLRVLVDRARECDLSCAFLYARPGGATRTDGDLTWARGLAALDRRWPVHLANDLELRVAAPDDLAA